MIKHTKKDGTPVNTVSGEAIVYFYTYDLNCLIFYFINTIIILVTKIV